MIMNIYPTAHIDGLAQDCIVFSAVAMELLQSCTKPSIYFNSFPVSNVNSANLC